MSTNKLRLGPLPKAEIVKLTVILTAELKQRLELYAQLHSEVHGDPVDAVALIPHMLDAFIARDREFLKCSRKSGNSSVPRPFAST
ncbi:DUF2274 domain-containing protein [Variovorax sp. J22G21]|uniref:DUF2274 domain-containing protein n=1 Tax=Variovorax fucosicus TaxID=3053517 RepID=UPI002576768A|nr:MULTISPECIES: DUF2274 domain-containing protein [unclassified Variovorax]MDM0041742.1 DUF2274 domain-containing protein [Variovorax sp. J22R193]MDM0059581.1 DUF2274 domain-containing protein [Variovorax sp. J22G21]